MPAPSYRYCAHRVTLNLLRLLVLAAVVASLIEPMVWPAVPLSLVVLLAAMRYELRLTEDEPVFRELNGSVRIPRAEIAFAKFSQADG